MSLKKTFHFHKEVGLNQEEFFCLSKCVNFCSLFFLGSSPTGGSVGLNSLIPCMEGKIAILAPHL